MVTRANQRLSTIGSLPPSALRSSKFDELMIDRSPKKTDKEVLSELERQLPNLPLVYLLDKKGFHYKNKTCAKFPTIYDININNIYWQETDTSNGTFYLYGAYLDVRKNNRLGPTVRILGMINRFVCTNSCADIVGRFLIFFSNFLDVTIYFVYVLLII